MNFDLYFFRNLIILGTKKQWKGTGKKRAYIEVPNFGDYSIASEGSERVEIGMCNWFLCMDYMLKLATSPLMGTIMTGTTFLLTVPHSRQ